MLVLITGGSGSGKSAYAEQIFARLAGDGERYYLATMQVYGEEGRRKVERHRRLRAGKGFVTIEQPTDICRAAERMRPGEAGADSVCGDAGMDSVCSAAGTDSACSAAGMKGVPDGCGAGRCALLECVSNLTANEMFSAEKIVDEETVAAKISREITELARQLSHLVIVTNNVFEDGIAYDETTMAYLRAMGRINENLARQADCVAEVTAGVPVLWKGSGLI